MSDLYMAFEIGCIECGEPSRVIGLFDAQDEAEVAAKEANETHQANWHGQRYQAVYKLDLEARTAEEVVPADYVW